MTLHDEIAYLDMLAAQLHARGWTAYISMPAGRVAALSVQDPHDRAQWSDVVAAPGGATGDWWFWFSWAERIGPIYAPAAAAEVIIRALQRPMDVEAVPDRPHLILDTEPEIEDYEDTSTDPDFDAFVTTSRNVKTWLTSLADS